MQRQEKETGGQGDAEHRVIAGAAGLRWFVTAVLSETISAEASLLRWIRDASCRVFMHVREKCA